MSFEGSCSLFRLHFLLSCLGQPGIFEQGQWRFSQYYNATAISPWKDFSEKMVGAILTTTLVKYNTHQPVGEPFAMEWAARTTLWPFIAKLEGSGQSRHQGQFCWIALTNDLDKFAKWLIQGLLSTSIVILQLGTWLLCSLCPSLNKVSGLVTLLQWWCCVAKDSSFEQRFKFPSTQSKPEFAAIDPHTANTLCAVSVLIPKRTKCLVATKGFRTSVGFPQNFHTISKQSHSHPVQTLSRPSHNSGINNEGWQAHYPSLSAPSVSGKYKLYQTQKTCNLENSIWLSLADQSGQLGKLRFRLLLMCRSLLWKSFQLPQWRPGKHPQLAASHFHQPPRLLPGARGSWDKMQDCLWLPEQWLKPAAIAEYAHDWMQTAVWHKEERGEEVKSCWLFFATMKNYIILCKR